MLLKIFMCFLSIVKHSKVSNTSIKMEIPNVIMVRNDTIANNDTYRIERFLELIKNSKLREEEIRWDSGEVEW